MLNSLCLCGRLTHDIEVKTFDSGAKVSNFSIAVQRNFKNKNGEYEADFISCKAWGATADFLYKYFKKGDFVVVSGEIRAEKWQDDNGTAKTFTYMAVNNVTSVNSKGGNTSAKPPEEKPPTDEFTAAGFEDMSGADGNELPF